MDRYMDSHDVDCPPFTEWIERHARTAKAPQGAHEPYRALVEDARGITREGHPVGLIVVHKVSLRYLTSRDVAYRFRR